METENILLSKMLKGDANALSTLLSTYHNYLVVVGLRYLSDRQRVEDVIHDLFADLWDSGKEIELSTGVKSFLRGGIVNKCLSVIRKESRINLVEEHSTDLAATEASADQLVDGINLKKQIDLILNDLPEKCRQVFKLSRYDGKSHQEIADELGISKKTIENHITKALKTFRSELKRKELLIILFFITKVSSILGAMI